ncbi:hypothetical protein Trydic_g3120 [Trypoxylus dichotomus]
METKRRLIPRNSKPHRLYGLPKIHKVNTIDSPTYNLAKYLARFLKEYTGRTPSHGLNSTHFGELISGINIQPTDLLVSFDVVSLFTKVSIPDSLNIIQQLLEQDNKSSIEPP